MRAAEDEREAEHVIDLIGKVAAPGRDDGIGTHGANLIGQDLGLGIGEREHDWLLRHLRYHFAGNRTGDREADEYIRPDEGVGNGARLRLVRELGLVRIERARPPFIDHALPVSEQNVLPRNPKLHVVLGGRYRRCACAGEDDANLFDLLSDDLERVEKRSAGDDCRAVLVVVEDGNLHRLPQCLLDIKAIGRANVFEIDSTDGGLEQLTELDDVVGILRSHLEIEHVEISELLEEICLALHHGLGGQRADVAEPEHCGPIAYNRDEIALRRVLVGVVGVRLDLEAGHRNSRRVGECEVALIVEWLGRYYRDLPGASGCVVVEGIFTLH